MSDSVELLVAEAVDVHRPQSKPPFETLEARWRRRRTRRQSSAVAAVALIAAAALAGPAVLRGRAADPGALPSPLPSSVSNASPSPLPSSTPSRPTGPVPLDVTAFSACIGMACHTVTDARHIATMVDDLNAGKPHQRSPQCAATPVTITLTFTGPRVPYLVVEVPIHCDSWTVRGKPQRYEARGLVRESALQAQRLGIVVHDCGITASVSAVDNPAPEYIGLTLEQARSRAAQAGLELRVLGEDGQCHAARLDLRLNRVNLYLERGRVITAARF